MQVLGGETPAAAETADADIAPLEAEPETDSADLVARLDALEQRLDELAGAVSKLLGR